MTFLLLRMESLYSALRALRYSNEDKYRWVDAVCIN